MHRRNTMLARLAEMEARLPMRRRSHAMVMYNDDETPEQGWRRYNGAQPFPDPAIYQIMQIQFVKAKPWRFDDEQDIPVT